MYTWFRYFKMKKKESIDQRHCELFHNKHNCVVMYRRNQGMIGWGSATAKITITPSTYDRLFEPIIYFLNTAEESVDVAIMLITVQPILKVLHDLLKRGIKVRMILDHDSMKMESLNTLVKLGASISYYVNLYKDGDSFMHHKFAVKDFHTKSGYLCLGSLNWTISGFFDNYEDLVFTNDVSLVETFHEHFEFMWKSNKEMKSNVRVKTILSLK